MPHFFAALHHMQLFGPVRSNCATSPYCPLPDPAQMKKLALLSLATLLTACASGAARNGPYAPTTGSTYERQVIGALGETEVKPEQRAAVLAAYDHMAPQLKRNDADDLRLQRRWAQLDPRASDYLPAAEALAAEAAAIAADRLKLLAQFNQTVASTLDGTQWARWSAVMSDQRAAFENARRLDPTFRPDAR